jgi:cardiolipin synthase
MGTTEMQIFKPGPLEVFFLKLAVVLYDLVHPKRALEIMLKHRNFRSEVRTIIRANRRVAVSQELLERVEWIRLSTHGLFKSSRATLALLSDRIHRRNVVSCRPSLRSRYRCWRNDRAKMISLDRHEIERENVNTGTRNLNQYIQRTIELVSSLHVTTEDLVFYFEPAVCSNVELLVAKPGVNAFYDILIPDLERAQSNINIIMYGFRDTKGDSNSTAARIAKILCEKAQSGVEVNLLLDGIGSGIFGFRQNDNCYNLIQRMAQNGVNCVLNDPWNIDDEERLFKLDHRKQFVIDGIIAYVGGMGIEDQFDNNHPGKICHDIMVRLEGQIVHQFQCSFLSSFTYQFVRNGEQNRFPLPRRKGIIRDKYFPVIPVSSDDIKGVCLQNIPVANIHQITEKYHQFVEEAREFAFYVNPYCSEDSFVRALNRSARTNMKTLGRRLREGTANRKEEGALVLLPGEIISGTVGLFKRFELPRLILSGVKIVLYNTGFLHAKAAVQDHYKVLVGSCNLDAFSMWRNWESAIFFENRDIAGTILDKVFCYDDQLEKDKYVVLSSTYSIRWYERVVCWFIEKIDRFV